MDPLRILLDVLQDALKQAVPEVEGRVYLRRNIPRAVKEVSFIQIALGDEVVESLDAAPRTVERTRTINITLLVRGELEEAYDKALVLRGRVIAIMREIQMIPGEIEDAPCLVDDIYPSGESEPDVVANGEKYYTGMTLTYDAVYVTEEGSPGVAGPGIPQFNVLEAFQRAVTKWTAKRGAQIASAEDNVQFEET